MNQQFKQEQDYVPLFLIKKASPRARPGEADIPFKVRIILTVKVVLD